LIGGVAFVIIMVLVIFFDLGEPFGGIWKIHLDDWKEFLWNMDHDDDPHIIFVYKRQNTVAGRWKSAIGRDTCTLFNLVHAGVPGRSWKQFVDNVERPRPNGHPRLKCLTFFRNQLDYNGLPIAADWPVVALKRGGQREVFLDSEEINGCQDWSEFESAFHQKLKEHLPWYEQ
jgi:hypothetical protein